MKFIYCTCNVSMLETLIEALEEVKVREYQVIDKVTAKNKLGDPRFNTPVWPGYNSAVLIQVSQDEKAKNVMQRIREMNKEAFNNGEIITACTWTLDDYCFE